MICKALFIWLPNKVFVKECSNVLHWLVFFSLNAQIVMEEVQDEGGVNHHIPVCDETGTACLFMLQFNKYKLDEDGSFVGGIMMDGESIHSYAKQPESEQQQTGPDDI